MPNELSLVERIGSAVEVLGSAFGGTSTKSIPFATYGVTPYASGTASGYRDGNFWTAGYSGNHQPGAQYDYNADAGELLDNPIIAAGSDLLGQALPAAPPILQEKRGSDWKDVPDSDEVALLMTPMQPDASGHTNGYGGFHLWRWVVGFEMTRGEAFWLVDSGKNGLPAQLRVERPEDFRILSSRDKWVSGYEILIDGKAYPLKDKEVVHFRHALDHSNPRRGWSPALSAKRHVAGDNRAATYQAALMRNVAAIGLLIGIKDGEAAARMTPDQVEDFVRTVKSINGENAGMSKGLNLPLDVHKLGLTPDEMALEKLVAYYETRICAAIGIDPMLLSLGGSENRTYSNYAEAEEALWRRCIQPRRTRHSSELGAQYLPLWGRDPSKYRIWWDYSDVAALQEDKDKLHMRVREDYKAGGIDRYMFLMETNRAATEADKGVYATGASATQGDEEQAPVVSGDSANTATQDDERDGAKSLHEFKKYDPRQPRDDHGKWTDSGGRLSVGHAIHVMKAEGITDEKHHATVREAIESGRHKTREDVLRHIDAIHGRKGSSTVAPPQGWQPAPQKLTKENPLAENHTAGRGFAQDGKYYKPEIGFGAPRVSDASGDWVRSQVQTNEFDILTKVQDLPSTPKDFRRVTVSGEPYIEREDYFPLDLNDKSHADEVFSSEETRNKIEDTLLELDRRGIDIGDDIQFAQDADNNIVIHDFSNAIETGSPLTTMGNAMRFDDLLEKHAPDVFEARVNASRALIAKYKGYGARQMYAYGSFNRPAWVGLDLSLERGGGSEIAMVDTAGKDGGKTPYSYIFSATPLSAETLRSKELTLLKMPSISSKNFKGRYGEVLSAKKSIDGYTPTMTHETKTAPDDINADSFMAAFNAAKANMTGGEILESPAPLPDPFGIGFTDEELEALTDTNSEEAVKLAFGKSTEAKRALLSARVIEQDGEV